MKRKNMILEKEYENITIIQDTREKTKKHDHILEPFNILGVKVEHEALPIGDYALKDDWTTVIDTKQDLFEVINNVTTQHERFRREMIKAKNFKIKLIILVEQPFNSIYEIQHWKVPRFKNGVPKTKMNPETLMKIMLTQQEKYGIKYMFCDKNESAMTILKILVGGINEIR